MWFNNSILFLLAFPVRFSSFADLDGVSLGMLFILPVLKTIL